MDRAAHPCPWPECRALTTHLRGCPKHRPATKTVERGYDHEWRVFAAHYLRLHPDCAKCGRRADRIDHRIAIRAGGARLDPRNCQSLCGSCHVKKTKQENSDHAELNRWR